MCVEIADAWIDRDIPYTDLFGQGPVIGVIFCPSCEPRGACFSMMLLQYDRSGSHVVLRHTCIFLIR